MKSGRLVLGAILAAALIAPAYAKDAGPNCGDVAPAHLGAVPGT
jgi:hypothetical protein